MSPSIGWPVGSAFVWVASVLAAPSLVVAPFDCSLQPEPMKIEKENKMNEAAVIDFFIENKVLGIMLFRKEK